MPAGAYLSIGVVISPRRLEGRRLCLYGGHIATPGHDDRRARARRLVPRVSRAAAAWGMCYALYRGYYALGGTALLPGTPVADGAFRRINAVAAVILGVAAVLPLAALPLWSRRHPRLILLALYWVVAVGCCMHALIDSVERVLSLAGLLQIDYPASVWVSIDRRTADLQDLFLNEPWFLLEGLAFGVLGWLNVRTYRGRRCWTACADAATLVASAVGLLSATGVIGKVILG
jgi:hypothetical protein